MSGNKKALILVAAVAAAVALPHFWPATADDDSRKEKPEAAAPQEETPGPRPRSGSRRADPPLSHAIEVEEKLDPREEAMLKALDAPTDVNFIEVPLEDCVAHLRELSKLPIWVDRKAIADEELALDQPVTLQLSEV